MIGFILFLLIIILTVYLIVRDNELKKSCEQKAEELTKTISDVNKGKYSVDQKQYQRLTELEEDMNRVQQKYVRRDDWRRGISASNIVADKISANYSVTKDMEVLDNMRSRDFILRGSRPANQGPKKVCVTVEKFVAPANTIEMKNATTDYDIDNLKVNDFMTQDLGISYAYLKNTKIEDLTAANASFNYVGASNASLQNAITNKAQISRSTVSGTLNNPRIQNTNVREITASNVKATSMFASNILGNSFETTTLYTPQGEIRKVTAQQGVTNYTEASNALFEESGSFTSLRGSNLTATTVNALRTDLTAQLNAGKFNASDTLQAQNIQNGKLLTLDNAYPNLIHVDTINATRQINVGNEPLTRDRMRELQRPPSTAQFLTASFDKSNVFKENTDIYGNVFLKGIATATKPISTSRLHYKNQGIQFGDTTTGIQANSNINMNALSVNKDRTKIGGSFTFNSNFNLNNARISANKLSLSNEFAILSNQDILFKLDANGNIVTAGNVTFGARQMIGSNDMTLDSISLSRDGKLSTQSNINARLRTNTLVTGNTIDLDNTQLVNTVGELALSASNMINLDGKIFLDRTQITSTALFTDQICLSNQCFAAADLPKFRNKGDRGITGKIGEQGLKGITGIQGARGRQGPQGPEGPPGDDSQPGVITSSSQLHANKGMKLGSNIYFAETVVGPMLERNDGQDKYGFGKFRNPNTLRFYQGSTKPSSLNLSTSKQDFVTMKNDGNIVFNGRPQVVDTIQVTQPEMGPWIEYKDGRQRSGIGHSNNKLRVYGPNGVSVGKQDGDTYNELLKVDGTRTTVKSSMFCVGDACATGEELKGLLQSQEMPKNALFNNVQHNAKMQVNGQTVDAETLALFNAANTSLRTKPPVNCELGEWTQWSECINGKQYRTRDVKTQDQYTGTPCEAQTETQDCGPRNCQLSDWSDCMGCGIGMQTRTIAQPAQNGGTCEEKLVQRCLTESGCVRIQTKYPNGLRVNIRSPDEDYNTNYWQNFGGYAAFVGSLFNFEQPKYARANVSIVDGDRRLVYLTDDKIYIGCHWENGANVWVRIRAQNSLGYDDTVINFVCEYIPGLYILSIYNVEPYGGIGNINKWFDYQRLFNQVGLNTFFHFSHKGRRYSLKFKEPENHQVRQTVFRWYDGRQWHSAHGHFKTYQSGNSESRILISQPWCCAQEWWPV